MTGARALLAASYRRQGAKQELPHDPLRQQSIQLLVRCSQRVSAAVRSRKKYTYL